MFLDRPDPVAAWQELGRRQAGLVEFMSGVQTVRIEADGTDLTLSVAGRTWINSDGRRQHALGRDLHRAVEDSRPRPAAVRLPRLPRRPASWSGSRWSSRRARSSRPGPTRARTTCSRCSTSTPAPALGELGLGLNSGIDRFTGSILYDEKIGGTVHLALGQSYPETGGVNASALHWDLIVDTREGRPGHGRRPGRDGRRTLARR